ncbi:(11Z)-hexadec-11-enoyl-CoA conjugase-like [Battus philenor]|uniref:(11Z)-hexadec-11-enoyl-CoA conjugase-like n=1 Tax=Battus philenor TaxID=42288 RepID=UPI0035CEC526
MTEFTLNDKTDQKEFKKNSYISTRVIGTDYSYKHKVVWKNAIGFLIMHLFALWGLYILITGGAYLKTAFWALFVLYASSEGITIGAHRLYSHKSFTATPALRAFLIFLQTAAGQNSLYIWCRDHRLHHRYSDTDADPHNAKRGFFFSHIGWLMTRKHPYVIELGKRIDMSDLEGDWMVMWQKKYYYQLYIIIALVLPVWVPIHYWGESFGNSLLICYFLRYMAQVNGTWLVNSAAHLYGTRPYDKNLQPVESWFVSLISLGEGWHNYHHTFPWDYKAAELSMHFNMSATFIEMFEKMGLASNLKTASPEMVSKRIMRTGDGTHYALGNEEAKSRVRAFGPLHPLNPSYNVIDHSPNSNLQDHGLPLYHEFDILKPNGVSNRNPNLA